MIALALDIAGLFPEPNPRPAAVLGNELDAGRFQCGADRSKVVVEWNAAPLFKIANGAQAEVRTIGKLLLGPVEKPSSGPALCWRHHGRIVPFSVDFVNGQQ